MLPRLLTDIIEEPDLRTIVGIKGEELISLHQTIKSISRFGLLPTIAVPPIGNRVTQSRRRIKRLLEEEFGFGEPIQAYIARSSSYDEQPGRNRSIPVVYDARFVSSDEAQHKFFNGLWKAMNDVRAKENMPILIQHLEAVFEDGYFGAKNFSFVVHSHSRRGQDDYTEIVFAQGLANNCVEGSQSDWAILRKNDIDSSINILSEKYGIGRQKSGAILNPEGRVIQDKRVRTWNLEDMKLHERLLEISKLAIAISEHQSRPVEIEGCYTPLRKEPTLFQLREVKLPEADPNFRYLPLRNRIIIGESTYCVSGRSFRERGTLVVPESIIVSIPHLKVALREVCSNKQFIYERSREAEYSGGLKCDTGSVIGNLNPSVYLTGTLNPASHAVQGGYFAGNGIPICEINLTLPEECRYVGGCRIYNDVMVECDKNRMRVTIPNGRL